MQKYRSQQCSCPVQRYRKKYARQECQRCRRRRIMSGREQHRAKKDSLPVPHTASSTIIHKTAVNNLLDDRSGNAEPHNMQKAYPSDSRIKQQKRKAAKENEKKGNPIHAFSRGCQIRFPGKHINNNRQKNAGADCMNVITSQGEIQHSIKQQIQQSLTTEKDQSRSRKIKDEYNSFSYIRPNCRVHFHSLRECAGRLPFQSCNPLSRQRIPLYAPMFLFLPPQ